MRTRLLFLGLLLPVLVLSGCTEEEPEPIMPTPSSHTPTPTPEPEAWEVHSRAGVKAFLQRYVEIYSAALETGDTDALRGLATACDGCDQIADQIDKVYQAGGHIEVQPLEFTGWSIDETGLEGGADCVVVYESSLATWVRTAGAEPETYPGGKIQYLVNLAWSDEAWTIVGLSPLESS